MKIETNAAKLPSEPPLDKNTTEPCRGIKQPPSQSKENCPASSPPLFPHFSFQDNLMLITIRDQRHITNDLISIRLKPIIGFFRWRRIPLEHTVRVRVGCPIKLSLTATAERVVRLDDCVRNRVPEVIRHAASKNVPDRQGEIDDMRSIGQLNCFHLARKPFGLDCEIHVRCSFALQSSNQHAAGGVGFQWWGLREFGLAPHAKEGKDAVLICMG